jgi:hypothetical protein
MIGTFPSSAPFTFGELRYPPCISIWVLTSRNINFIIIKFKTMSKFRSNFMINSIDTKEYAMKDGSTHKMKVLNLLRMRKDPFTGKYLPALKNSQDKTQVFPMTYVGGELVKNAIYGNVEMYKAEGACAPIATIRWDTSDFNFPSDGLNPLPRKSIKVSVFVDDESESDEDITNNLLGQALYQLRTLGVTILDEYGSVATYKNREGITVPAISSTVEEHAKAVSEAQARTKALQERVAGLNNGTTGNTSSKDNTQTEKLEFDEEVVKAEFIAANPNATEEEIEEHLFAEVEKFDAVNAAN